MKGQLEKMQNIKKFLSSNVEIRNLINYLAKIMANYDPLKQKQFLQSKEVTKVSQKMTQIKLEQLEDLMDTILQPETIIALPITIEKYFTLFFVIIPGGHKFDWHDHPDMIGKTKCLYGNLTITSIDRRLLVDKGQIFTYNLKDVKQEHLCPSNREQSVSTIDPESYNIHKIEANEMSAFFDLLMPDYPNDECLFLETVSEDGEVMRLRKIEEPSEEIKSFDEVVKELSEKKVKNIILQ